MSGQFFLRREKTVKKKVKEEILDYIHLEYPDKQFQAQTIADHFKIKRSVASHYLNQLVSDGNLDKSDSLRPVKFYVKVHKTKDVFSDFIGADGTLKKTIEKCKAAVMYPPNGLPLIIRGKSGVGKSFLASLIHKYAIEKKVIAKTGKFVVVNCADYANNPELLSAVLFGYKKGAFTGAEKDTEGLLAVANGGYLFLDEVHNLSSENQEKLFLLLDAHKYKKLGEGGDEWQYANIRMILATTENISSALLGTFRRRIPAEIILPDYYDRSTSEKMKFLYNFFLEESKLLGINIECSVQLFSNLLCKDFDGNIGELKNKIKLLCAEGYLNRLHDQRIILGDSEEEKIIIQPHTNSFYHTSNGQITMNTEVGKIISTDKSLEENLENLSKFFFDFSIDCAESNRLYIDELNIFVKLIKQLILPIFVNHGIQFNDNFAREIALFLRLVDHLDSDVEKLFSQYLKLYSIKKDKHGLLAKNILKCLKLDMDRDIPTLNWILFLLRKYYPNTPEIHSLIIIHGEQTATSMAREANKLLESYVYDAFDLPIDGKTEDLIVLVNDFCSSIDTTNGLVVLVDMGSLEQMYERIEKNVTGDLVILNNVSTALTLDCGLKIGQKKPVSFFQQMDYSGYQVRVQYFQGLSQKKNVIVSCLSGKGISEKVKEVLVTYTDESLEVLTFDFTDLKRLSEEDSRIFSNTLCVISSTTIFVEGTVCLNLEDLISGSQTLDILQDYVTPTNIEMCLNELVKLFTIEGASTKLRFLDPKKVFNDIETVILAYEKIYNIKVPSFLRINLFLHLSGMIERILVGDSVQNENIPLDDESYSRFELISRKLFKQIESVYSIQIPKGEFELIYNIFDQTIF